MFLPVCKEDMKKRGWDELDFVYVSGDAYVDHPSFGVAIISRLLEAHGFKIGIIPQPDINKENWMLELGTPKLGFLVTSGNIDSMVNHYTVNKNRRNKDNYSPGGKMGKRPDYAVIKYCNAIREKFPDTPIIIGGIEASLRRLAHYDYISNQLMKSILIDSKADLILYGMGERNTLEVAEALQSGLDIHDIIYVKGTVWKTNRKDLIDSEAIYLPAYGELSQDKLAYARSFYTQYRNTDFVTAKTLVEEYQHPHMYVVQNTPSEPLDRELMDWTYDLPYERTYHPIYNKEGGVPAIQEVQNSITINRGCFGSCSFCALTSHQGRIIQSRSKESVMKEAEKIINSPSFKGYIHDVGGPTANFYNPSCEKQLIKGTCGTKQCLFPTKCTNLQVTHTEYLDILKTLRNLKGVKKVFVRSGIRYDYLMYDKDESFFRELIQHHISGQLKVAPEHVSNNVLYYMQKPNKELYDSFVSKYYKLNKEYGKNQFLVPYLMTSHPGCTLEDAVMLAEYLKSQNLYIEQVQDFFPTPCTLSTCMYYTGVDPRTMEEVYIPRSKEERAMQRALVQYSNPKNYDLVKKALIKTNRLDLIGYGPNCLITPKPKYVKNKK